MTSVGLRSISPFESRKSSFPEIQTSTFCVRQQCTRFVCIRLYFSIIASSAVNCAYFDIRHILARYFIFDAHGSNRFIFRHFGMCRQRLDLHSLFVMNNTQCFLDAFLLRRSRSTQPFTSNSDVHVLDPAWIS